MTAELRSLLELQADDDVVDALSAKLEALAPRVARLEVVREAAVRALNQARGAADEDEKRQREGGMVERVAADAAIADFAIARQRETAIANVGCQF